MKIEPAIEAKVEWLLKKTESSLSQHLGIEYLEYHRDRVVARMPVDSRTKQPFGLLHGGASLALAESLASVGGVLNVDEETHRVVGIEINANHLRATREGWVQGIATPLHRGKRTQVWEVRIAAESDGKLICISRCTLAVVDVGSV